MVELGLVGVDEVGQEMVLLISGHPFVRRVHDPPATVAKAVAAVLPISAAVAVNNEQFAHYEGIVKTAGEPSPAGKSGKAYRMFKVSDESGILVNVQVTRGRRREGGCRRSLGSLS